MKFISLLCKLYVGSLRSSEIRYVNSSRLHFNFDKQSLIVFNPSNKNIRENGIVLGEWECERWRAENRRSV